MTSQEKRVADVVRKFAEHRKMKIPKIMHIRPRCYVVAHRTGYNIIVAVPPVDCVLSDLEEKLGSFIRLDNATTSQMEFEPHLTTGDWCSVAYVSTDTGGLNFAVRCVK